MGVTTRLTWKGEEIMLKMRDTLVNRVDLAGFMLLNEARALISRDQPRGKTASGMRTGLDPSKPGTPPKRVTGTLHRSTFWDLDRTRIKGRVGTPLKYGLFLEIGTSKLAPRPWLSLAMKNKRPSIRAILSKPMKV